MGGVYLGAEDMQQTGEAFYHHLYILNNITAHA